MKAYKLFPFIAVFISAVSLAQTTTTELVFSGGLTIGSLRGNEFVKEYKKPLASFAANALVKFPVANNLNIVTGLQYERLGIQMKDVIFTDGVGSNYGRGTIKDLLHYASIPAYLEYNVGNKIRFGFELGGFGSILLKHSTTVDISQTNVVPNSEPIFFVGEVDDNDVNAGLLFGINAQIPLGTHKLQIGIRDQYGLVNLNTVSIDDPTKTNLIFAYAGLTIKL